MRVDQGKTDALPRCRRDASFDDDCLLDERENGLQTGFAARVDAEDGFPALDGHAGFFEGAAADGEIDDVSRTSATGAESNTGAADEPRIETCQTTGFRCGEVVDDRCAMHFGDPFKCGSVAALRFHECDEFFPRG